MSEFDEPYRDWDPFIAWNELKEREDSERLLRAPDEEKERG